MSRSVPFFPSARLLLQYSTFHTGVIKDVKDPHGRLRVKVEVQGLLDSGKPNWTEWINLSTNPIGSSLGSGDVGMYWPPTVGQSVRVGFLAGQPFALYAFIGPPIGEDGDKDDVKPLIPSEARALWKSDKEFLKNTKIRLIKSEAGHTILMDDNGKQELSAFMNWTGSGLAFYGPGKEEDDKEKKDDESKIRKGKKRASKNVFSGSADKPSALIEGGKEYTALADLMAQGLITIADDKGGGMLGLSVKLKDGSLGPTLVLDGQNDRVYISTSKNAQIQLYDDADIFVTRQLIHQVKYQEVKDFFSGVIDKLKEAFKKYE
jgi:hypothetical protein